MYLVAKINLTIPHLSVLSIETRPEYVDLAELEFLKRGLDEGDTPTTLELAIGFEAFDERIRNEVFKKGLSLVTFESFVANLAPYKYAVKCYFMQKPVPEMTDEQAVRDVQLAIDHLSNTARKYGVELNMHLNPTYAAHSTPLAVSFSAGNYAPPRLIDVARAASYGRARGISIFIGLYDEGLAVPGGSFVRDGEDELLANLEIFNKTQDFDLLERLVRHHGKSTPLPKKI
jgi:radical SAM enzyme (TIGR01210 family)